MILFLAFLFVSCSIQYLTFRKLKKDADKKIAKEYDENSYS
jgi:hypothetical protein